jgi:hypothetical protein
MRRLPLLLLALLLLVSSDAIAQSSVYSVLGIGFVGRPIGTRARGTEGGVAAFDPGSALNPATVARFRQISVTGSIGTSVRSYEALGVSADGLSDTRSPFGQLAGWIRGTPVSFAFSFYPYADRTYHLITSDSVTIRGDEVGVSDRISSDGAVTDVGGTLAYSLSSRVSLGAALHLITGSTRAEASRSFDNPVYRDAVEQVLVGFSGIGVSGGFMATLHPRLRIAGSFRTDSDLKTVADSVPFSKVGLPVSVSGGLWLIPSEAIQLTGTVTHQSWSDAHGDLQAIGGANAFDTWEVGTGVELGGTPATKMVPLRLGFRYAELPFSPNDDQAREIGVSFGTAILFAGGRGIFDLSIERISRKGAGAEERAWYFTFALTGRP